MKGFFPVESTDGVLFHLFPTNQEERRVLNSLYNTGTREFNAVIKLRVVDDYRTRRMSMSITAEVYPNEPE